MPNDAPRPVTVQRLVPLAVLLLAGALFMLLGGHRYATLGTLADNREWLQDSMHSGPGGVAVFVLAYAGLVSLSVPGGALLTIAAGFVFGPCLGTLYAAIGATIGATAVFLAARAGLGGLSAHAGRRMRRLAAGLRAHGLNYLVVARLIPIFPFWLVNLAAGALGLPLSHYILGTFIGMLPVTFIYASLGNGFGTLVAEGRHPDLWVLAEPRILLPILALAALALLPVLFHRRRGRPPREAA